MDRKKQIKVAKIILKTVALAGVISIAVLAPNALQALDIFYNKNKRKYNKNQYLNQSIERLRSGGYIEFKKQNGKTFVNLTEKGKERWLKYQLGDIVIKKPKKWDQKWRIITFDIKEERKNSRNILRKELINLGFIKLQNSVWVFPYECESVVIMLKSYLKTGKDILYITAEKIENDKWLKKEFNLF
ncbi:MAG: CRISPR-associated endonuclease Cas2 [Parcubacteria group bacterium]|nr:CRISPR-associated endonuclease Cas2 [Parcubacteria group bacterium]MCR4342386.1 CRISPR-associated endonuclease Cas2 [Patescibacteria group bacterium]